jgi:hypothetical protein
VSIADAKKSRLASSEHAVPVCDGEMRVGAWAVGVMLIARKSEVLLFFSPHFSLVLRTKVPKRVVEGSSPGCP